MDNPGNKAGEVLVVRSRSAASPASGPMVGRCFHTEAFSFQIATDTQEETDLLERHRWQRWAGKRMRWCKGPLGELADYPRTRDRGVCCRWRAGGAALAAMMTMQDRCSGGRRREAG